MQDRYQQDKEIQGELRFDKAPFDRVFELHRCRSIADGLLGECPASSQNDCKSGHVSEETTKRRFLPLGHPMSGSPWSRKRFYPDGGPCEWREKEQKWRIAS